MARKKTRQNAQIVCSKEGTRVNNGRHKYSASASGSAGRG